MAKNGGGELTVSDEGVFSVTSVETLRPLLAYFEMAHGLSPNEKAWNSIDVRAANWIKVWSKARSVSDFQYSRAASPTSRFFSSSSCRYSVSLYKDIEFAKTTAKEFGYSPFPETGKQAQSLGDSNFIVDTYDRIVGRSSGFVIYRFEDLTATAIGCQLIGELFAAADYFLGGYEKQIALRFEKGANSVTKVGSTGSRIQAFDIPDRYKELLLALQL